MKYIHRDKWYHLYTGMNISFATARAKCIKDGQDLPRITPAFTTDIKNILKLAKEKYGIEFDLKATDIDGKTPMEFVNHHLLEKLANNSALSLTEHKKL